MQANSNCNSDVYIPRGLIWVQCIAFTVLYGFWILPEIVGFRNTALVVGALAGLYPIYRYRFCLIQKQAIPTWLIFGLFIWATFHLLFLAQDFTLQLIEFGRIWKYAALATIFALGLGISMSYAANMDKATPFWITIYFGLCIPVLTYLLKYSLTNYGVALGFDPPVYLRTYMSSQPFYIQKTDYISFCLPVLAISLGFIRNLLVLPSRLVGRQYLAMMVYILISLATLFLFYIQDTKNGIAYAVLCFILFSGSLAFERSSVALWRKLLVVIVGIFLFMTVLYPHVQKNPTWSNLIADTKVGFRLDEYPQWKYSGQKGYPNNEHGRMVSITTYERAAWFKAGLILSLEHPMGYGLVEDSFKKMAIMRWPDASTNLSHSHSGWLDIVLALGFPGFILIFGAVIGNVGLSRTLPQPWKAFVLWSSVANLLLSCTTEIATTTTFNLLIFWISLSCGLILIRVNPIGLVPLKIDMSAELPA